MRYDPFADLRGIGPHGWARERSELRVNDGADGDVI
jgi:hypothetical protein